MVMLCNNLGKRISLLRPSKVTPFTLFHLIYKNFITYNDFIRFDINIFLQINY
jgi:hypothetical protein